MSPPVPAYFGDIHAGTIALRSGNPTTTASWEWRCGFYPGSEPGDATSGTAATFWEARNAFEAAWRIFLAKRTEADFQAWRDDRDRTAEKYALWDSGQRLPPLDWGARQAVQHLDEVPVRRHLQQPPARRHRCACPASDGGSAGERETAMRPGVKFPRPHGTRGRSEEWLANERRRFKNQSCAESQAACAGPLRYVCQNTETDPAGLRGKAQIAPREYS
jgi:hypothetical protein